MNRFIFAALFVLLGFAFAATATAASVELTWTPPNTRTSGTPLTISELGSYEITLNGAVIARPTGAVTSYTHQVAEGSCIKPTDAFAIRVSDTSGQWSAYSPSVFILADVCTPKAPPSAPTLRAAAAK